jgi:hypothetical protein
MNKKITWQNKIYKMIEDIIASIFKYDLCNECTKKILPRKVFWHRSVSKDIVTLFDSYRNIPSEEEIQGLVAQAYCTERNSKKIVDVDLCMDIAKVISKRLRNEDGGMK